MLVLVVSEEHLSLFELFLDEQGFSWYISFVDLRIQALMESFYGSFQASDLSI